MSITTEIERLQNAKKDIKEAIENKGVSVGNGLLDTYADKINQIETGVKPTGSIDITENGTYDVTNKATAIVNVASGSSEYPIIEGNGEHEVRFVDCDGTLIKVQYVNNGESATAPSLPTHDRLTFVEWNRDFDNITHDLDVGAVYKPTSGNTELFIKLTEETGLELTLYITKQSMGTSAYIDWGDGETTTTATSSGEKVHTHTYSSYGDYMISIEYDKLYRLGGNGQVAKPPIKCSNETNIYKALIKCYCGDNLSYVDGYNFANCINLELCVMNKITDIKNYAFMLTKMKALIIPSTVKILGSRNCSQCKDLEYYIMNDNATTISYPFLIGSKVKKIIMPVSFNKNSISYVGGYNNAEYAWYPKYTGTDGFTFSSNFASYNSYFKKFPIYDNTIDFGSGVLQYCGIETIKIPPSVTQIRSSMFNGCNALHDVYCYSTTPPTLGSTSAFNGTNLLLKIHVPAESLEAYQTATNWSNSNIVTKIVGDLEGEFEDGYN